VTAGIGKGAQDTIGISEKQNRPTDGFDTQITANGDFICPPNKLPPLRKNPLPLTFEESV
jgi:hypothetical protein